MAPNILTTSDPPVDDLFQRKPWFCGIHIGSNSWPKRSIDCNSLFTLRQSAVFYNSAFELTHKCKYITGNSTWQISMDSFGRTLAPPLAIFGSLATRLYKPWNAEWPVASGMGTQSLKSPNMSSPNPSFAHAQVAHPDNIIYLALVTRDCRKKLARRSNFGFGLSGFRLLRFGVLGF